VKPASKLSILMNFKTSSTFQRSADMDAYSLAKNRTCQKVDPTKPSVGKDGINVQLVLSLALGLSAFFGFCVSFPSHYSSSRALTLTVSSSTMEEPICCPEETE
jgi:hypothetical protein